MRNGEALMPQRLTLRAAPLLLMLTPCGDSAPPPQPDPRPVRVMSVEARMGGDVVSLTGTVRAETTVNLAFRIEGRMVERGRNVGDRVSAGQIVARLNRDNGKINLCAARDAVAAAHERVVEATDNYNRQRQLLAGGFTTPLRYDKMTQTLQSARSAADSARAQLSIAENRVSYTDLIADMNGTVTARGAGPGEVVQVGRMILQIA